MNQQFQDPKKTMKTNSLLFVSLAILGGTLRGTVVSKGKNLVDVKPADGGPVERYIPHWRGNRLDKDVLRQIAPIEVGQKVSVRWEYDECKRVLSIR
ncbi:MAG: hypothetical protein CMI30_09355 [Opitutae bacterium]|nr:hypothetical protein [Opitutae bacterium]